MTKTDNK